MRTLASPERGGAPKGRRGFASPELRIFDSWEGDRRRRRWWRGCLPSIAAGGGGGVHRTLRCEPFQKTFALPTVLERGAAKYIRSPRFFIIVGLRFGIFYFAAFVGLRPIGALPPSPLGLCPKPRKPFFKEKGLDPKNLFSFSTVFLNTSYARHLP